MNIIVKHDGTDISNWLVSYDREHDICTGIASVEIVFPLATPRTFHPWDVIEIWENSIKKGKFYITSLEKSVIEGSITLVCDDESKKLNDYFVTETYTIDYLSYSRTWIEKFLDEAGVSYSFTVDVDDLGSPLSNNTSLGFDSVFTIITTLLQQSGWYIYFDPTGTAIIGNLNKDVNDPDHIINANDFSNFERELDDDRLRNRAVVWGNTNPTYGEVFVDISVQTPWNYDANDKRAVVISNSSIYNHAQALELAHKLLTEFTQIKDEKFLLVVNDYNMKLGDIVKVNSDVWNGRGLITKINAAASPDGLVYGITLDQHCPRMFTFYSNLPPLPDGFYVYTGHVSDGIWRKYTESDTWSDDSAGLEPSARVNDLFIKNGTFATVLDDGYLYTRTTEVGVWNKYNHGSLRDTQGNSYIEANIRARACSINYSDNIIAGYNFVPSGIVVASGIPASGLSWVLELTGSQSLIKAEQVVISGGAGEGAQFSIYDLESTGEYNIVAASGFIPVSGFIMDTVDDYIYNGGGYRTVNVLDDHRRLALPPDSKSLSIGWGYGDHDFGEATVIAGPAASYPSSLICDNDGTTYWYVGRNGNLVKIDVDAETTVTYSFTQPTEWTAYDPTEVGLMLRHSSGNDFDIVAIIEDVSAVNTIYLYSYTLGDSTLTSRGSHAIASGAAYKGAGLIGTQVLVGYHFSDTVHAVVVNLITAGFSVVDIYTGMGAGYSGLSGAVQVFSTGDSITVGFVWATGTDIVNFPNCPLFPSDEPTTVELWASGYQITEYGGASLLSATMLQSFDTYYATDSGYRMSDISCFFEPAPAVNTTLNKAYVVVGLGITSYPCLGGSPRRNQGHNIGISFPDLGIWYYKASDDGTWWLDAEGYLPEGGSEWVGKNAGSISTLWKANFRGYTGKYSTPGYFIYNWEDFPSGNGWKIFRNVPSWTAFGSGIFSSYDDDDFGMIANSNDSPMDDLTGLLVSDQVKSGPRIVSTTRGENTVAASQIYTTSTTDKYAGLTQNFGVSGSYRIVKPNFNIAADFPKGTILKHTSTYDLGDATTASDDALEQTLGIFEIIKTTQVPTKVDIAHGVPTVIYDIPTEDGENSDEFWASITNEPDEFFTHAEAKPVYEARTLNLLNPSAFPTASGTFTAEDYERYIGISNREGILASEYDLSTPWVNLVTVASGVVVSGLITHFETSNFVPEGTYMFYTVSGVKSFFQKNPDENYWRDYTAGLPDSGITIIRVDDVI